MTDLLLPRVQNYAEYRDYLRDWFRASKSLNSKISFRYVSKHLGLKSPNHFQLVITKQRHFSKSALDRMQTLLRLRSKERNYLELLFAAETETNMERIAAVKAKIGRLHSDLAESETPNERLSMLSNSLAWYMKMGALHFTDKSFEEIRNLVLDSCPFPLSETEIRSALSILENSGSVKFQNQKFKFEQESLKTGWDMDDETIKQFHHNNLALAIQSIQRPVRSRYLSNVTIPANAAIVESAKKEIRDLCLRLLELSNSTINSSQECQQVISLQFAMFPYFEFKSI